MKSRTSMEEKISLRLFFMGLLGLCLTAALCIFVFHKAFSRQVWQDLENEAGCIAAGYAALEEKNDIRVFGSDVLRVTLIEPGGTVLYDSAAGAELENHLTRPEICDALENGEGRDARQSATMGYRTYYYAVVLADGNVLRLAQDAENTWSIYDEALPAVLLCCLVIMALAIWISWLLTRSLIRPIMTMTEDLDHIRERVPYRELAPMAQAIDSDRLLRENNALLRQEFTANVSHELKTPLTSISGYAELIENGMAKPADVAQFAARIHAEAARMIALVNDILQLSQLDSMGDDASRAPKFETVDLAQVAKSCAEGLRLSAQKAYVTLTLQTSPAVVNGDRMMLAEICQNLCDNAIRYNRPGGRVIVSTGHGRDGKACLTVRDNGIGIPKEAQSRVFERFYRVDKSHSKATGGTGLGLAIVKHMAMIHGAKIELESQFGTGTTITVLFEPAVE